MIKLAQAFPESRCVGYDIHGPNVDRAVENVRAAGLSDRITIRHADAAERLSGRYDLVTTFDVVHDAVNPRGILRAIREAHGEGHGTLGLHEPKLRELATEAGFSSVRRVPMDNPFNNLYELRL